uniref:Uncharacterized protein n=1 Tax=Romanomermis culicivorax TaxID=13658 RepID=A0A915JN98_ROMCU
MNQQTTRYSVPFKIYATFKRLHVRLSSTFRKSQQSAPFGQLDEKAPITLASYFSLCRLLSICHVNGRRYPEERRLLALPAAAVAHDQASQFLKNYAEDWWHNFRPLLDMPTYQKIVGLSVTLNGLQKINCQTNGKLIDELGFQPIFEITKVALRLWNLPFVMPGQYYRILQSLHKIYRVEKTKPGNCVVGQKLFSEFLPQTLEVIVLNHFQDMENFESTFDRSGILHKIGHILTILHSMDMPKLKSYDSLLRLSFLCYQSIANQRLVNVGPVAMMVRLNNFAQIFIGWNFDPANFIPDFWPQYFRVFNKHYRLLNEATDGSFYWLCFYNCHLVALHFGRFRDFKDIAYGLTSNRAGTVSLHNIRTQAETLLNLAQKKSANKYLIQRFKDILSGNHIVN